MHLSQCVVLIKGQRTIVYVKHYVFCFSDSNKYSEYTFSLKSKKVGQNKGLACIYIQLIIVSKCVML